MKKLLCLLGMIAGFNAFAQNGIEVDYVQNLVSADSFQYSSNKTLFWTVKPYVLSNLGEDSSVYSNFIITKNDFNHPIYSYTLTQDIIQSRTIHYDKLYGKLKNCYFIDTKKTTPHYFVNIKPDIDDKVKIELTTSTTYLQPMVIQTSPDENNELGNICKKYL